MSEIEILKGMTITEPALVHTDVASCDIYPMENHGRRHYGLIYTVKGTEIYRFGEVVIHAVPDSVLVIPKGERYSIELDGKESVAIVFDFEAMLPLELSPFCIKLNKNNPCRLWFADAEKAFLRRTAEYTAECKAHFYKIIAHLIREREHYLGSDGYLKIAPAVEYLHAHYLDGGFRLEDAVQRLGISRRYFETLFFLHFKMTAREYINQLRVELAKELLLGEKNSVTDVAAKLAFSDIYHFSKFFKKKTGYTPTEFKKM